MPSGKRPPEPWDSFLTELDAALFGIVRLDCIGGFVVTQLYGSNRTTADMDVIEIAPHEQAETFMHLALRSGPLARKHLVYVDRVGVAAVPDSSTLTIWPSPSSNETARRIAMTFAFWPKPFRSSLRSLRSAIPMN